MWYFCGFIYLLVVNYADGDPSKAGMRQPIITALSKRPSLLEKGCLANMSAKLLPMLHRRFGRVLDNCSL